MKGDEGLGLYADGCRLPAELRAKDTGAFSICQLPSRAATTS